MAGKPGRWAAVSVPCAAIRPALRTTPDRSLWIVDFVLPAATTPLAEACWARPRVRWADLEVAGASEEGRGCRVMQGAAKTVVRMLALTSCLAAPQPAAPADAAARAYRIEVAARGSGPIALYA